jgi:hypothetical protein
LKTGPKTLKLRTLFGDRNAILNAVFKAAENTKEEIRFQSNLAVFFLLDAPVIAGHRLGL